MEGTVIWFSNSRGYGFAQPADGRDVFVHYSNIQMSGYKTLKAGQKIQFDIEQIDKGPNAINIVIVE